MSLLYVDSVMKAFGEKQVLTDIFLSCKTGEIIGLLGRNGAGKSTLLKIIFGSLTPDYKFIRIDEKILNGVNDIRKLIKYLPQDDFFPPHIRFEKIISLFCNPENGRKLMENIHIQPLLQKKAKDMSGGERRLAEVMLMILTDADFIMIDEPFNGISPLYKDDIKAFIKEQSIRKGFIITDHDYRSISEVATRIELLHDGGLKHIKNPDDLKFWGYLPESTLV